VTEPWRVERAEPGLLPRLRELAVQSFDAAWSEGAFAEEFRAPGALLLVARDGRGAVRGYLSARCMADEVHLLSLAVEPASRRRGAAAALLERALEAARGRGARIAHLEVRAGNPGALAFYARAGFRTVGRRRRYYPDGEDALLLARPLAVPRCAQGRT
jgi:[ribosomal protein S18]-alanine N-acetyltransferase